jgi:hypothetical protein
MEGMREQWEAAAMLNLGSASRVLSVADANLDRLVPLSGALAEEPKRALHLYASPIGPESKMASRRGCWLGVVQFREAWQSPSS